jgi:hypothetical protein
MSSGKGKTKVMAFLSSVSTSRSPVDPLSWTKECFSLNGIYPQLLDSAPKVKKCLSTGVDCNLIHWKSTQFVKELYYIRLKYNKK